MTIITMKCSKSVSIGLVGELLQLITLCFLIVILLNCIHIDIPMLYKYFRGRPSKSEYLDIYHFKKNLEIFCINSRDYSQLQNKQRPGLVMLRLVFDYLPEVRYQYSSIKSSLHSILRQLTRYLKEEHMTTSPWKLARKWASPYSLIGHNSTGLGDILFALNSYKILSADIGFRGTQLKLTLMLNENQKAVFKPKRYGRYETLIGATYDGADKHNGEIAAFHLSRLLNLTMVPLTVGRRVSLIGEILPVATHSLSKTFFMKGGRVCFYGDCYYCRRKDAVCDHGRNVEGAVILWLPDHLPLTYFKHPWARVYKMGHLAKWELNPSFCHTFSPSFFTEENLPKLLNLVDAAVFDFLIQNGDRHHVAIFSQDPNSPIILLDNGKSFSNPMIDHLDILAPLIQCCRIRKSTFDTLVLLTGGGLSKAMRLLLSTDPLSPVLSDLHLKALDRRLLFILAAVAMCEANSERVFL